MGACVSRFPSSDHPPRCSETPAVLDPADGLRMYEATYNADDTLRSFDSALQERTSRAINSIAGGFNEGSLSLESFTQVIECLLEVNHDVVKIIMQNKRDIWKNKELVHLVEDYFDNSLLTLDFCTSLDSCIQRAGHIESIINVALHNFREENSTVLENGCLRRYTKTLEKLENLRNVGDPFTEDFFKVFDSVSSRHRSMLERLQVNRNILNTKLAETKAYKRISNVIFIASFATVLICSVVAAAVAAPPVVTALAAALAVPMGPMGKWLNSTWRKYEKDLKQQVEIVDYMHMGSRIVIKDLENIRVHVERFRIGIQLMLTNANFAIQGTTEEEVFSAAEEIRKEVVNFCKTISEVSGHANKCFQETRMARTLLLKKIINYPNGSMEDTDTGIFS